jgi:hypothetical protein
MSDVLYYFRKGQFKQVYTATKSVNPYCTDVTWTLTSVDGREYRETFHDAVVNQYLEDGFWRKTDWKGEETIDSYFAALSRGTY